LRWGSDDDGRGEFLVKARKYEGKTRETPVRERRVEAKEKWRGGASFTLAGLILILALCDLGDLFTSY
jgi:hypothetical protein